MMQWYMPITYGLISLIYCRHSSLALLMPLCFTRKHNSLSGLDDILSSIGALILNVMKSHHCVCLHLNWDVWIASQIAFFAFILCNTSHRLFACCGWIASAEIMQSRSESGALSGAGEGGGGGCLGLQYEQNPTFSLSRNDSLVR